MTAATLKNDIKVPKRQSMTKNCLQCDLMVKNMQKDIG